MMQRYGWMTWCALLAAACLGCMAPAATYQHEEREQYEEQETPAAAAPLPQDPAPVEAAPPTAPDPGPPAIPDAEAAPEPSWTTEQPADESPSQRGGCCKICRKGCACGNTCISCSKTCRVGPGCACDG